MPYRKRQYTNKRRTKVPLAMHRAGLINKYYGRVAGTYRPWGTMAQRLHKKYEIHDYKRQCYYADILAVNTGGGAVVSGAGNITPMFSDITAYTEFQALYDQYKILKIIFKFTPKFSSVDIAGSGTYANSLIYVVHDYDDNTNLTSRARAMEYSNMKSYVMTKPFRVVLYPKLLRQTYQSAIATSYVSDSSSKSWIDAANVSVPHYGIKWWHEDSMGLANNTPMIGVTATFFFKMKNID